MKVKSIRFIRKLHFFGTFSLNPDLCQSYPKSRLIKEAALRNFFIL